MAVSSDHGVQGPGTTETPWARQGRVQTRAIRNQVSPKHPRKEKNTFPVERADRDLSLTPGGRAEGSGHVQTRKLCAKRPVESSASAQCGVTQARPPSDALPSCRSSRTVAATAAEPGAPRPATDTELSPPSMLASAGLMTSSDSPALQVTQNQGAAQSGRPRVRLIHPSAAVPSSRERKVAVLAFSHSSRDEATVSLSNASIGPENACLRRGEEGSWELHGPSRPARGS